MPETWLQTTVLNDCLSHIYARVVGMKNVKSLVQLCARTGENFYSPLHCACVCVCVKVRKEYTFARVTVETNHTDTGVSMHNL